MSSSFLHQIPFRRSLPLPKTWLAVAAAGVTTLAGCRTAAPLHAWSPPQVVSAVGKTVAIAPLEGPRPMADEIESQLFQSVPRDPGRAIDAIAVESLRPQTSIRLTASADPPSSDLALLPLARQRGIDFLLMGEVLRTRSAGASRSGKAAELPMGAVEPASAAESEEEPVRPPEYHDRVSVAWRIYDVAEARPLADRITVTAPDTLATTPGAGVGDRSTTVSSAQASGHEVWRLLSPSLQRHRIPLAVPWLLPGSQTVRQGNELASNGRWPDAERLWRQTLDRYPFQHAARTNLAMAAAARQDFSTAKRLIREAIYHRDKSLYRENLAWIELRQRDYHAAFGLPDPPEGWFLTTSSPQTP